MRSTRYAALLASGYTLLAVIYIIVSSGIAARMSADVEQMRRVETMKGVLYVVITAIGIFLGARFAFGRLEHAHAKITARDRALLVNERRVFAGLMAGSIAHDANNVLVAVLADLDTLRRSRTAGDAAVERLQLSVDRLVALNSRLLTAARRGGANPPEQVDLGRAIRDSLEVARAHDPVRGCRIDFANGGHFVLVTHPLLVHQIVMNLVLNAAEATEGHGRIDVRISGGPQSVMIEVHDNGPGVAPERRERIFEALETTKQGGSGLGLFSVRACATALGATVEVTDSPLGGACFRLRLPDHAPAMNGDPIHELVGLAGPAGGARRA